MKQDARRELRRATFALAEAYESERFRDMEDVQDPGNAAKARDPYAKAYAGGIKAAKDGSLARVGDDASRPAR